MTILFFVAAFISEVVGTIAGFGSSTIFLPLALFFVDFKSALVLVAVFHLFGNLGRIAFFLSGLNKRLLLTFGLPCILLALFGAALVNYFPQSALKMVLGFFLLAFGIASLVWPELKFRPNKINAIVGGSLSGFLAGLIGTGGALRGAFLTSYGLDKTVYIATAAAVALAVDVTRIPIYFGLGFFSESYYLFIPVLFLIALSGSYIGRRIVAAVPQKAFRKIVLLALVVMGIKFISEGL
jgi:hypothetical protein